MIPRGFMVRLLGYCIAITLFTSSPALSQSCTNPSGDAGDIFYNNNYDVFQGCSAAMGWLAFHEPQCADGSGCAIDPCTGNSTPPTIGETCTDGSIYAGDSPDGNVAMYTTPSDATLNYTWNDGTGNYIDMSMENCTDSSPGTAATCQTGEANTAFLVGATGEPDYPFAAAEYCDGLTANGHSDWYLPAQDELNVLYTNKNTGDLNGTFNETGSFPAGSYWSSSESGWSNAKYQRFSDGSQDYDGKFNGLAVRCVRKSAPPAPVSNCTDPVGNIGDIIYSSDNDVFQGCTYAAEWVALHGDTEYTPYTDPTSCDIVGEQCDDGSYYIGDIDADGAAGPNSARPVYATDETFESNKNWNNGTSNWTTTGFNDLFNGEANTFGLAKLSDAGSPYEAAEYCLGLSAHGYSDWYLPSRNELALFWDGGTPIANVNTSGSYPNGWYWSSSDRINDVAYMTYDGSTSWYFKNHALNVRCVRPFAFEYCTGPYGDIGEVFYNASEDVFQGCTQGVGWTALHHPTPHPCTGTYDPPALGETCGDGTVYAGQSPVGGAIYTTPADAPSGFSWNDGTVNYQDTAMENCDDDDGAVTPRSCYDGKANTAFLVGATGEPDYPFAAAEYCDGLSAYGHDDWYLPARDQLTVLHTNRNRGDLAGTFNDSGSYPAGYYWSSTEPDYRPDELAFGQRFGSGSPSRYDKPDELSVRCIRQ